MPIQSEVSFLNLTPREFFKNSIVQFAAILGFAVTLTLGAVFLLRPVDGHLEALCEQPKEKHVIHGLKDGKSVVHFERALKDEHSNIFIADIHKSLAVDEFTIDCKLKHAWFLSNGIRKEQQFSPGGGYSSIPVSESELSFSNWRSWIFGLLISWLIISALILLITDIVIRRARAEIVIFALFAILLIAVNRIFAPALVNAFNSLGVVLGTLVDIVSSTEGSSYNYAINSLMNFVPRLRFISVLSSILVLISLVNFASLFKRSKPFQLLFVVGILFLFAFSPLIAGYSQFIERSTLCCWVFSILIGLILKSKDQNIPITLDRMSGLGCFSLLLILAVLRTEYVFVGPIFLVVLWKDSWKAKAVLVSIFFAGSIGLNSWVEKYSNPNWLNLYVAISLYEYVTDSIQNTTWTEEEIRIASQLYKMESLIDPSANWYEAITENKHYPSAAVADVIKIILAKAVKRPIGFLYHRIQMGLHSLGPDTWRLTPVTIAKERHPNRYLVGKLNGFIASDDREETSEFWMKLVEQDGLGLQVVALLSLFILLHFRFHPLPAWGVFLLSIKLLIVSFMMPARSLAYVFDMYFLALPMILLFIFGLYQKYVRKVRKEILVA